MKLAHSEDSNMINSDADLSQRLAFPPRLAPIIARYEIELDFLRYQSSTKGGPIRY